ncbi:MAG TPA: SDR family oxidoreductase [Dehalococcoidia bacterium]|nr:SDR family oxidoreductase [Dehalococcoidia bacterium]
MAPKSISQLFDLTGKGAIVTGAGMGLGQAIALRLAEAGASVMVTDINMEAAGTTVEQIRAGGGTAESIEADAARAADAEKVVQATVDAFGRLDILVNNAGIFSFAPPMQMQEETWDRTLDINLKGMFFNAQAAAREMIKAGRGGKIVNMASMDGVHPTRLELVHYNASKGGVIMLTKALALELGPHNILVNAVSPGPIMTPGSAAMAESLQARGAPLDELTVRFWERLPLGRMGEPDDVATVALFLASAAADYMTGSIVLVDGGYLLT